MSHEVVGTTGVSLTTACAIERVRPRELSVRYMLHAGSAVVETFSSPASFEGTVGEDTRRWGKPIFLKVCFPCWRIDQQTPAENCAPQPSCLSHS